MDWLWNVCCGSESHYAIEESMQAQGLGFAGDVESTPHLRALQDADFERHLRLLRAQRCAQSYKGGCRVLPR